MTTATISPRTIFAHGLSSRGVRRPVVFTGGSVADVFTVHGCVRVVGMHLEITQAVENVAVNMQWVFDSDTGGDRIIGDAVNIQAASLGDFYVSELDGTAIVKITTSTGLPHGYFYQSSSTNGTILTAGGLDVTLSASPATGEGLLHLYYKPILHNSCVVAE